LDPLSLLVAAAQAITPHHLTFTRLTAHRAVAAVVMVHSVGLVLLAWELTCKVTTAATVQRPASVLQVVAVAAAVRLLLALLVREASAVRVVLVFLALCKQVRLSLMAAAVVAHAV
jgi:hypothetical protein